MKFRLSDFQASLRTRFALGLGTVLLPFFFAAAVGQFYLLPRLTGPFEELAKKIVEGLEPINHLQVALLQAAMPPNDWLIHGDPAERQRFSQLSRKVDQAFEKTRAAPFAQAEERALVESAQKEWREALRLGAAILRLRHPVGNREGARDMERLDAHIDRAAALLDQLHDIAHEEIKKGLAAARTAKTQAVFLTVTAFVLALAISLLAALWLSRPLLTGLGTLRSAAARLAAGNLAARVMPERNDELGQLALAFNAMAEKIERNKRALDEHGSQLNALNQIAIAITSLLSLQDILDDVMRRGIALTGAKASCIAFYDETTALFTQWVTQGLSEHFVQNMSFRPGGMADEAFASGSYILSNDRPETGHKLSRLAREEGLRCFICLPLTTRDRRLGVIYFYRTDRDTFTPTEIELLATLASLAAQAIGNARLYAQSQEQARTDVLTGLDNRREFQRRLDEEIERARRYGRPLSLLMLDIDCFKAVNDTHGHPAGDEVLRVVAARIRAALRPTDHTARYGGEEFAVILPETAGAGAVTAAEHIRGHRRRRHPDGAGAGIEHHDMHRRRHLSRRCRIGNSTDCGSRRGAVRGQTTRQKLRYSP